MSRGNETGLRKKTKKKLERTKKGGKPSTRAMTMSEDENLFSTRSKEQGKDSSAVKSYPDVGKKFLIHNDSKELSPQGRRRCRIGKAKALEN